MTILNPFVDPSGVNLNNPLLNPLLGSNKKNILLLKDTSENNRQNNLETIEKTFNMTTNKIIKQIKDSRKDSSKSNNKKVNFIFANSLDNKKITVKNDKNVPLSVFMNNVNKNFDKLHNSSNSFFNNNSNKFSNTFTNNNNNWKYYSGAKNMPPKIPLLPPPPPPTTFPPPPQIPKTFVDIQVEIESLDDLLKLISDYPLAIDKEYNINMAAIHQIESPLRDLNKMIGMHKLKNSIVDQILYFVQNLHKDAGNKNGDFMHTVIYGPPGTGKTEVAKIMGKIFSKLGILSKNKFKKVTRADLIAGYLGQTALKTQDVVKECIGGVLFIDEAYALGNPEKRDSFAKECIDTLCEALSDNKNNLMVIIAGYEKELKKCFFAYNQGLDSRFTWRFKTDDYKENELNLILQKKVEEANWKIKEKLTDDWFKPKMEYFKYYGRDMETLFAKTKIAHSRRVFCLPKKEKKNLIKKDFDKGFELFLLNDEVKSRKDNVNSDILNSMYV
jgi:Cdc6-like AAA superfamily ATPase